MWLVGNDVLLFQCRVITGEVRPIWRWGNLRKLLRTFNKWGFFTAVFDTLRVFC